MTATEIQEALEKIRWGGMPEGKLIYDLLTQINDNASGGTYKSYVALLTQSGTEAPTAIELENTIGDITFIYDEVGEYLISSDSLFTLDKTWCILGSDFAVNTGTTIAYLKRQSENYLKIVVLDGAALPINDELTNTPIEIRVYN